MPDPSYKSETAAMHSKAKELRAKVTAEAKKKNVSVSKTALDNFVDTYKKTKVGPIQRAIGRFISGINTKADYTSGKSTYAKENTNAQSNRAKAAGGRSAAQSKAAQVERDQRKLAAKSKAAGGKSVLSRKPAEAKAKAAAIAKDDTVDTLYFADSLGNMNNEEIINVIDSIKTFWKKDIGIHTHNNQGQALSNSMTALENGVTWLDSTVRGMGRGAGNSTTEDLMRLINKKMNDTNYSPQELYEICLNDFDILQKKYNWGQNLYYALAADFDIHPTYVQEMLSDNRYSRLDILDIINNLKDVPTKSYNKEVLETIKYKDAKDCHGEWNANGWCTNRDVLIIGNGPSSLTYYDDIIKYINQYKPLVLSLNMQKQYPEDIVDGFVCANLSRATLESKFYENIHKPIYAPKSIFLENPNLSNMFENIKDYGMALKNSEILIKNTGCVLPYPLTAIYAFALASIGKANNIFLVGFDGYDSLDFRQQEMINAIDLYKESPLSLDLISLTPTTYPVIKNSIYAPK